MKCILLFISLLLTACVPQFAVPAPIPVPTPTPIACTQEAKLCPDGTAVGRTGPKCEFAACPPVETQGMGYLVGQASVGPICPVERPGIPCPVPPVAYTSRGLTIQRKNSKVRAQTVYFQGDGSYRIELAAGEYLVSVLSGGIDFSKEFPREVTIKSGQETRLDVSIDTGIR